MRKVIRIPKTTYFYIGWILMVFHFCVANSNAELYSVSFISYIGFVLFGLKIVCEKHYTKYEIIKITCLILFGFISQRATGDMRFLWFSVVLAASKNVNFNKVVKLTFCTTIISCFLFFTFFIVGLIPENAVISSRGIRHSLGLGHPNMCSAYFMLLSIEFLYLYYSQIKKSWLIYFLIGSLVVFSITKSITGFFTMLLMILIVYLLIFNTYKKFIKLIVLMLLLLGITIFTLVPLIYNDNFSFFDRLLTGRLHQANYYFIKYGISLFGHDLKVELTSEFTDNILDIGYTKMLLNNGFIYYLLVTGSYIICLLKTYRSKDSRVFFLLSFFVVYMFTENVATYIFMNVSMLNLSDFIFRSRVETSMM